VEHCRTLWLEAYEDLQRLISQHQDVTTVWWPFVSRGRVHMTECDISALISPRAFKRVFLGDLAAMYRRLDHGAYHLDGPGTECHVPALLEQPGLHCIQWVPGPGVSALAHAAMLRRIQEAGVSITCSAAVPDVEEMCRVFDKRRLFLRVGCQSEAEAKQLLDNVLRWCA
jgi:hypothetical protein